MDAINKIDISGMDSGFEIKVEEFTTGSYPSISADSSIVVFTRDGDIYSILLDGKNENRLTLNQGNNITPVFQP